MTAAFRDAGQEVAHNFRPVELRSPMHAEVEHQGERTVHSRRETAHALDAGPRRVAAGLGAVFDGIFTYFTTIGAETLKVISAEERGDMLRESAKNAVKQHSRTRGGGGRAVEDAAKGRFRRMTAGPGQPRSSPLPSWQSKTRVGAPNSRSKVSLAARSLAHAYCHAICARVQGAKCENGAELRSKRYVRDIQLNGGPDARKQDVD